MKAICSLIFLEIILAMLFIKVDFWSVRTYPYTLV